MPEVVIEAVGPAPDYEWYTVEEGDLPIETDHFGVQMRVESVTDNHANNKVDQDTFDILKRNKPQGWTWDYYLRELLYPYDDGALDDKLERTAEGSNGG